MPDAFQTCSCEFQTCLSECRTRSSILLLFFCLSCKKNYFLRKTMIHDAPDTFQTCLSASRTRSRVSRTCSCTCRTHSSLLFFSIFCKKNYFLKTTFLINDAPDSFQTCSVSFRTCSSFLLRFFSLILKRKYSFWTILKCSSWHRALAFVIYFLVKRTGKYVIVKEQNRYARDSLSIVIVFTYL